jgi:mannose-6-phosphate isomerase-like protein (cupin superfamily)
MRGLLLALSLASLYGADGTKVWTSADLKTLQQKMAATKAKVSTESLAVMSNYQMSVPYRNSSGEAELHHTRNDIFYVISGACTLVTGGTIPQSHVTQANEVRGPAVSGGTKRKLGPGDFLTIPAGVPHQMLLDAGGEITYAVVKVNTK